MVSISNARKAFSVRRPVLRHSCVKRWQDHDFRWRHPAEARGQSSRCNGVSGGSGDQDHGVATAITYLRLLQFMVQVYVIWQNLLRLRLRRLSWLRGGGSAPPLRA
jgi:hypothetical protein